MPTARFILDDDPSDVSAGSGELFDKRMLVVPENQGGILITVPFGTIKDAFFYSEAGQPGNPTWPEGAWAFDLEVLVANIRISAEVFINRVAADGTVLENYAPGTSPQSLGSSGIKHFSGMTNAQVLAPLPTDTHRLRLGIKLSHNGNPGSQNVTIGFGNPAVHILGVPIEVLAKGRPRARLQGAGAIAVASTGAPGVRAASSAPAALASSGAPRAAARSSAPAGTTTSTSPRGTTSSRAAAGVPTESEFARLKARVSSAAPRAVVSSPAPASSVSSPAPPGEAA